MGEFENGSQIPSRFTRKSYSLMKSSNFQPQSESIVEYVLLIFSGGSIKNQQSLYSFWSPQQHNLLFLAKIKCSFDFLA